MKWQFLTATAVISFLISSDPSAAQAAPEGEGRAAEAARQSERNAPYGGEILVTARRREESILRVPVVASVLDATIIERQQITDLYDVANRVPGFIMAESVGTVGIQASLRGVGPTSQSPSVDQSVSLNIDGLQLSQGFAFNAAMFDVAQVEVLKGPQALFFGKNSPAGVISLRSADPTDSLDVVVRTGYEFEAREKVGELIVSGSVAPDLKLRFAGRFSDSDGFFRNNGVPIPGRGNVAPHHRRFAPEQNWVLRGTALWEPSDTYKARLKVNYVDRRMEGNGGDGQIVYCPDGTGGVPPLNIAFIGDSDCKLDRYTQLGDMDPAFWPNIRNNGIPFIDSVQIFGTLEQNMQMTPEISLTSVTGLYKLRQDNLIRGSGSSNPTIAADFRFRNRQLTQEVRIASDFDGSPLNFTVGLFYQDALFESQNALRGNRAFGLPPLLQSVRHEIQTFSASGFGQLLWKLTDQLELAGGARYTNEIRQHREQNGLAGGAEVNLLVPRIEANNISPEFSLTYTPTDDLTLFGSYRQGFKSGSFNTIVYIDPNTRADFSDEKAKGFEAGIKARLLDRLNLNLSAYRYIYSDLQVGANEVSATGGIILRTINAASAKVQGVELDAAFTPRAVQRLTLRAAVNYNHARYSSFPNAPCGNGQTIGEGCNQLLNPATGRYTSQDLKGRPLVRAPDWTANFGIDYEMPVGNGLELAVGASGNYSSSFFTNLIGLPAYQQDSFFKFGGNVSVRKEDGGWEAALIGNNLTNRITAALCSNSNTQNGTVFGGQLSGGPVKGPAGSDELGCVPERGREVWLRLTLRPAQLLGW